VLILVVKMPAFVIFVEDASTNVRTLCCAAYGATMTRGLVQCVAICSWPTPKIQRQELEIRHKLSDKMLYKLASMSLLLGVLSFDVVLMIRRRCSLLN
jgi:hypothetical protein